jgi:hypothetical protein
MLVKIPYAFQSLLCSMSNSLIRLESAQEQVLDVDKIHDVVVDMSPTKAEKKKKKKKKNMNMDPDKTFILEDSPSPASTLPGAGNDDGRYWGRFSSSDNQVTAVISDMDTDSITFGRNPSSTVQLSHKQISRLHATSKVSPPPTP